MRPDLFKATIARVPFVDVVTTMLGPTIPLTTAEWEEWGDPRKEEFYFYMKSYSPVDNVCANDVIDKDGEGFTMVTKKAGNAGTATVKGYGTCDIHPNVSGSKGSNWNGGNNKRGSYNSVNKDNQGQSSPDSMEKISAKSYPASDLLVNNSDNGKTKAIESKCDTRVNSNLGNHDCLNPMNDILDTIEDKKQGRKERRHKEAQDVLAAATTAAVASSMLSSFRKDKLEESAHHEGVESSCTRCERVWFILPVIFSGKGITVMIMAPLRLEKGAGVLDKLVIEKTTPGRESEFDLRKSRKMAPPYRVTLHNDNYNKWEYVVQVLMKLTRIGRDAVLYVESLIESIMGGLEGLINILDSEGGFGSLETHRSWEPSDKADLHFVYKDVEGVSTQWDDIQRKLRNLPPKPSAFNPDPFTPAEDEDSKPKTKSRIDNKTEELKDLEDDLDDSCFLEEYKYLQLP
ncbi:unnamed protein product [Lactuca saligna]|uniref:Peptidase S9 prolyl oligopeptidase catalytic domain-containing protein n=1 Tax=Lactuca saligna TaxID=75948 RepID=A0AA35V2T7_LACSI|nr:unnamed protein product [Lactuca saligna]